MGDIYLEEYLLAYNLTLWAFNTVGQGALRHLTRKLG